MGFSWSKSFESTVSVQNSFDEERKNIGMEGTFVSVGLWAHIAGRIFIDEDLPRGGSFP